MKNNHFFTIGLIMLLFMTSCCKDVITTQEPQLPSLHTTILGVNYDFPEPTHYEVYDNRVDCHYYGDGLLLDVILHKDNYYVAPTGLLNGVSFIILFHSNGTFINLCKINKEIPIKWDMK